MIAIVLALLVGPPVAFAAHIIRCALREYR